MVPVDMRALEEDFENVDQMMEKLGAKGTAEAFVKARAYFEENKDKEPEDERPKPMTALEWRQVLEEEDGAFLGEGEEEEMFDEDACEEEIEYEEAEEEEGDADGGEDEG